MGRDGARPGHPSPSVEGQHFLDAAQFAFIIRMQPATRTASPSPYRTFTDYSLPVSRRTSNPPGPATQWVSATRRGPRPIAAYNQNNAGT